MARASNRTTGDQAVDEFHAVEGGEQTLGRLAAYIPNIDHEEVQR